MGIFYGACYVIILSKFVQKSRVLYNAVVSPENIMTENLHKKIRCERCMNLYNRDSLTKVDWGAYSGAFWILACPRCLSIIHSKEFGDKNELLGMGTSKIQL